MPKTKLFNMDCMNYMVNCKDNQFDLVIVDPPYGICTAAKGHVGHGKFKAKDWDSSPPDQSYFEELMRISKNQVIWGGHYFQLPISNGWIIWDKENRDSKFGDCELAWTSFSIPIHKVGWRWAGYWQQDQKNREQKIHPTQKPIAVYSWILRTFAEKGQTILDTHLGSGSSAIAAYYYGCDFVGIEIDAEYFDDAQKRFQMFTKQCILDFEDNGYHVNNENQLDLWQ